MTTTVETDKKSLPSPRRNRKSPKVTSIKIYTQAVSLYDLHNELKYDSISFYFGDDYFISFEKKDKKDSDRFAMEVAYYFPSNIMMKFQSHLSDIRYHTAFNNSKKILHETMIEFNIPTKELFLWTTENGKKKTFFFESVFSSMVMI